MSTQNKISEEQLKSLQEKVASIQNLNSPDRYFRRSKAFTTT
jgi:hypothetical protein